MPVIWINPYSQFNPKDLSPVLWFDADDASTITASSGSVSQWNDKSTNALHATQSTSASQPTTGSVTLNGRNVIDFDGTADFMSSTSTSNVGRNVTGITTYAVLRYDNLAGGEDNVLRLLTGGTNARIQINLTTTSGVIRVAGRTLDADGLGVAQSTNLGSGSSGWITQVGLYDIANTDLYQYINGTLNGSNTAYQTATTTSNTNSTGYTLGSGASGANLFDGAIAELLIFNSLHNATTRQAMYDYLLQKWGV
jgi:hypothetical protein